MIEYLNMKYLPREFMSGHGKTLIKVEGYSDSSFEIRVDTKIVEIINPAVYTSEDLIDLIAADPSAYVWHDYTSDLMYILSLPPLSLEEYKLQRKQTIAQQCQASIIAGFTSTALGTTHVYPSNTIDQTNLTGVVMKSVLPNEPENAIYPFKCMDTENVWAFRAHTKQQIQTVGSASYTHISTNRGKNSTLQGLIDMATTTAEVDLVVW